MNISMWKGNCLCGTTTFTIQGEPINPHLCSCSMCQKSSGAPTVAWVNFSLQHFQWDNKNNVRFYRSSEKTQRFFCQHCGSFLGALDDNSSTIAIVIMSLKHSESIVPNQGHSYHEKAPSWWHVLIK